MLTRGLVSFDLSRGAVEPLSRITNSHLKITLLKQMFIRGFKVLMILVQMS